MSGLKIGMAAILVTFGLSGCGGGGGADSGSTTSTSVPLASSYKAYILENLNKSRRLKISGNCSGNLVMSYGSLSAPKEAENGVSYQEIDVTFSPFYENCVGSIPFVTRSYIYADTFLTFQEITSPSDLGVKPTTQTFYSLTNSLPINIRSGTSYILGSFDIYECRERACNINEKIGGGVFTVAATPNTTNSLLVEFRKEFSVQKSTARPPVTTTTRTFYQVSANGKMILIERTISIFDGTTTTQEKWAE